ncbi:MAG: S-methyl-5-thioribose-1-phosphate isomerase [bacterium]
MRFTPIERVGSKLRLLAQTKLPQETCYLDLDDYRQIIAAIKRLDVRGAPAIGIAAAYGLAVAVEFGGRHDCEYLLQIAGEFKAARPTAVNLAWAVDRVMGRLGRAGGLGRAEVLRLLWSEAEAIHEEDRRMCSAIGNYGASLIADGDAVLTHCNAGALATGGSGTALAVFYACHEQGKKIHVFADETRPLLQGARLTCWELMQEGIDVTLICDNTAATLMQQGRIDKVMVGTDRVAKNGDVANKVGTYNVAVLAKYHHLPFYVALPSTTFDEATPTGADIKIEQRHPSEVIEGFGRPTAPAGVDVYSPAFDITPFELVTAFITDTGLRPGGRQD